MSADSIAAELLADVEADPDAVLEEFDADSPEELVSSGGDHDVIPDDELDVDDVTASELFAGLASSGAEDVAADSTAEPSVDSSPESTIGPDTRKRPAPDTRAATDDVPVDAVVVSDAAVCVEPGGGAAIETLFEEAVPSVVRSRDGVELVGPDPRAERIDTDIFGVSGGEEGGESADGLEQPAGEFEQSAGSFEWVTSSTLE